MKKLLFFICILLQISRLSYSQVQVTQPYIFKSYIQSPVYKISTTDTAASKKAVRDTAAAIRAAITNNTITLTSNILEADNTLKTFKPFSSKQAGINIYTGTTNPDGTDRANLNGYWYATKFVGLFATPSNYAQINDASGGNTSVFITNTGTASVINKSGPISTTENNPTLKIERTVSGTGSTTGALVRIEDNPTNSGTISGSLIEGYIGVTKRLDFNPRVADGASAIAYLFDTHNTLTSTAKLISIRNNNTEHLSLSPSGGLTVTSNVKIGANTIIYSSGAVVLGNSLATFSPAISDDASAIAYSFSTLNALSTAGAKLASFKNQGTEKFAVDKDGYIRGDCPHAKSMFMDSSITINLDQNTWYQITNQTSKSTWPATMFTGFTDIGDTVTANHSGHYRLFYQINTSGVNNNIYEYRIMKKSGATSSEVWRYQVTGTGTRVLRIIETSIALTAGDKYWAELRSTSVAPGSVTLYGGQMTIEPIHLDL